MARRNEPNLSPLSLRRRREIRASTSRGAKVGAEAAGDGEEEHADVRHQRPQRITERRRPSSLDQAMADPRASVAGNRYRNQPAQLSGDGKQHRRAQGQARSRIMSDARARARMLAQIVRPKFRVTGDRPPLNHASHRCWCCRATARRPPSSGTAHRHPQLRPARHPGSGAPEFLPAPRRPWRSEQC